MRGSKSTLHLKKIIMFLGGLGVGIFFHEQFLEEKPSNKIVINLIIKKWLARSKATDTQIHYTDR